MITKEQTVQEIISLITEQNTRRDLKETLKLCMDSMKDTTLYHLLSTDEEYQERQEEYLKAFHLLQETAFTEEQLKVVNTVIARKDEVTYDCTANSYMAGLLDGYRILKNFDLTNE